MCGWKGSTVEQLVLRCPRFSITNDAEVQSTVVCYCTDRLIYCTPSTQPSTYPHYVHLSTVSCFSSSVECVPGFNFVLKGAEDLAGGRAWLWITSCVLLIIAAGGTLFLILQARSKALLSIGAFKATAVGYEKLNSRRTGGVPTATTSSFGQYSDRITMGEGCEGEDDEDDGDDDGDDEENIVYMGRDGTVYRKFRYGLLDEDEEIELEYDDESYSFR